MNPKIVKLECRNGIAVITVDNPPVNTIDAAVRAGLFEALSELAATKDVKALLLCCAGSTFFSGADIGEFAGPPKEAEYRDLFYRFESLPYPAVAAMHGTVMGGGVEIALALHYRVAAPATRFCMPEVTLGIIPGAGGTQRLPRLIGVEKTLELVIGARPVDAIHAVDLGMIDEVLEGELPVAALEFVRRLLAKGAGPRPTGVRTVDPATATPEIIERARSQARKQYPNRQAALTAIEAITAALRMPLAQGLEFETLLANGAKATVESKALVHVFFAERATRKVPGLPADAQARPVRKGGVVGAGTMGGGIAICFANAGLPVTVVDANAEGLRRGLAIVEKTYDSMVARGRLTPAAKLQRMALIRASLAYEDLADADVVIEAAFEDLFLKQSIFAELDRVMQPGAVLATNTSTLDIGQIANATRRAADVIGMHFFSPAHVMPLLEVVRTASTSASTIRTVMELAKPLRKTPVLAKVCYGFIGNRMMEGYAREAERIVLEGATPRQVDSALEGWGMAMGILAVFDMAGIDVGVNVHRANADKYPPDPSYYQADFALHAAGRFGQKNGRGYYRYVAGERARHDDPESIEILRATGVRLKVPQRRHSEQEILERCLYPLLNEGIRILEEGVAIRAADIDVVWTSGYGFPRYRGGPMFYADCLGLKVLYDGILKYRGQFGPMHWQPATLLETLARQGRTLHDWEAHRAGAEHEDR